MSRQVRTRPLSAYMAVLTVALIAPALVSSVLIAKWWISSESARLEMLAREMNDDALLQVERYLAGQIAMLQALATSPALDSGDLERFDRQARDLFGLQRTHIVMRDLTGQQRINTRLSWGSTLPRTDLEADRIVLRTKQPYVSDLFVGAVAGEPLIAVGVPVLRNGEVAYLLSATIPPLVIADLLQQTGIAEPYSAIIADRTGRIVARAPYSNDAVGRSSREIAEPGGDAWQAADPEKAMIFANDRRSALSGWSVGVGVRKAALQGPLTRSLSVLGGLAALLIVLGAALSLLILRNLLRSQRQLTAAVAALRHGEIVDAPLTPVLEMNKVGEALAETSVRLLAKRTALELQKHTLESRVAERTRELAQQTALLRVTLSTLTKSEKRYRLLAEHASDIVTVHKIGGPCTYVSPACLPVLGYTQEEFLALPTWALIHPDDHANVLAIYGALSPERPQLTHLHRLRHRQGRWIWAEVVFKLLDGNERASVLAAIRDVSERQRQSEELRLAKEAAEQASHAKTAFLTTMSHEIRTPLNAVIGYTDLLLDDGREFRPENRRRLELIRGAGAALLTVVNDILDFSKIEAGQVELEPRSFALSELVDDTLAIVRGLAPGKDLRIEAHVDPDAPKVVVGDPDRLRQVLLNLLNNAIKFTPSGSVTLSLRRVDPVGAGERLRFAVADTGIGIAADKQGRLFQRFSQADGSIGRVYGGAGLGLAITKQLVGLMGGEIGFESVEGRGSTFWFTLALPAQPERAHAPGPAEAPPAVASARILVVEDLDINQDLLRAVLTREGCSVDVAVNGTEAVQAVENKRYDIVLMDIQMPVMDGIAATERIRNGPGPRRDVPIIALTATVLPDQIARYKAAGMNDHVGKPFRRQELLETLSRWLPAETSRAGARKPEAAGAHGLSAERPSANATSTSDSCHALAEA